MNAPVEQNLLAAERRRCHAFRRAKVKANRNDSLEGESQAVGPRSVTAWLRWMQSRRASLDWTAEGGCPHMSVAQNRPFPVFKNFCLHTFWPRGRLRFI